MSDYESDPHPQQRKVSLFRLLAAVLVIILVFALTVVTTKQIVGNSEGVTDAKKAIDAIQADRVARIKSRCDTDHKAYLAAQGIFDAIKEQTDLIDALIHQSKPADVPGLSPEQLAFLNDSLVRSDARLDQARQRVEEAKGQATGTDCTLPALPALP